MSETPGHVILCGLEGLSVRTLEELERLGERVVAVIPAAADPRHRERAAVLVERLVVGDPRDPAVLRDAGLATARALVLTADDDVGNIHIALVATAARPGLHVVVRTFDEDFGRRVEVLVPASMALSASAIAAPGFVSAILEARDERVVSVAGRAFGVLAADPSDARVAVTLADDRVDPPIVLPDPRSLASGPLPALVELDAAELPAVVRRRRLRAGAPGLRSAVRRVDHRFWILGAVLALITVGSAMVFGLATGVDPIDALYATVAGFFGAVNSEVAATPGLKVFAIGLTLVGAAALALFYGLIADVVLSARMRDLLGPRPTDLRDHVIVVGLGTIGFRIARTLAEAGVPVVAAERHAEGRFVEDARELGIPVVIGDAGQPTLLRSMGVDRARALAVVTDQDAANLATALHARGLRGDLRIVVRLFDPDLATHLGSALGAYRTLSVSTLAAPAFAAAAIDRQVLATIPVGARRVVVIARVPVEAGSAADGSSVVAEEAAATAVPQGGARILGVATGAAVAWRPAPDRRLAVGEELLVVAPRRSLAVLLARASAPEAD